MTFNRICLIQSRTVQVQDLATIFKILIYTLYYFNRAQTCTDIIHHQLPLPTLGIWRWVPTSVMAISNTQLQLKRTCSWRWVCVLGLTSSFSGISVLLRWNVSCYSLQSLDQLHILTGLTNTERNKHSQHPMNSRGHAGPTSTDKLQQEPEILTE